MKHSIVHTNRQLIELFNLPDNTIEFTLHAKPGELPILEIKTSVGIDDVSKKLLIETQTVKLELIPKN